MIKKYIFIFVLFISFYVSKGQQTPLNPISYRIFSPFIFNPAIAGSKDFFSIELITGKYGETSSQILAGNTRFSKMQPGYFSSPGIPKFTNIGIGGFLYNEMDGLSRNTGISGAGSYHIQLDKNALSFLSVGIAFKAVYNQHSGNPELGEDASTRFFPNLDFGIYYYNTNLFAGISATNLLGTPSNSDTLNTYTINVSRQLFLLMGYKFILSKSLNLILEPSLIINSDDSFSGEITDMLKPALKLYAGNFCIGTYFNDFSKYSFFLQYKYPRFYIGTYFALPDNLPFYKSPIISEVALGINISAIKSGISRVNHW